MSKLIKETSKIYIKAKKAYRSKKNVQKFLQRKFKLNTSEITNISYNLQTGSYIKYFKKLSEIQKKKIYDPFFKCVNKYFPQRKEVLDFGCGELTSSQYFYKNINNIKKFFANDISLNRILVGKKFLKKKLKKRDFLKFNIFCSSHTELPFLDNSIDLIITNHVLEPNEKYKTEILRELFRVSRLGLCLIEPHFEISTKKQQLRMKKYGYVTNLEKEIKKLNCNYFIVKKQHHMNKDNISSIFVIKKKKIKKKSPSFYVDHFTKKKLIKKINHLYSKENFRLYPCISSIPIFSDNSQFFLPNADF